jgi:hypothetical protein
MNNVEIWWHPLGKKQKHSHLNFGEWQLFRLGVTYQFDYIFIDAILCTVKIKRSTKRI